MKTLRPLLFLLVGGGLGYGISTVLAPHVPEPSSEPLSEARAPAEAASSPTSAMSPRTNPRIEAQVRLLTELREKDWSALESAWQDAITRGQEGAPHELLAEMIRRDPEQALALIEALPVGQLRLSSLYLVFERWNQRDSVGAIAAARQLSEASERDHALSAAINQLASHDPERAFALLSDVRDERRGGMALHLFSVWAQNDPAAAFSVLDKLDRRTRMAATTGYFRGRAQVDPAQALNEALAFRESRRQNDHIGEMAVGTILSEWVDRHPRAVLRALTSSVPQDLAGDLAQRVATDLARHDAHRLFEWAQQNLSGREQARVIAASLDQLAEASPLDAANAVASLPPSQTRDATLLRVTEQWSREAPRDALEWLGQQTPGKARAEAIATATEHLVATDPEGSVAYALSLDDPTRQKAILTAVGKQQAQSDPAAALAWSATLPPEMRESVNDQVLVTWAESAPEQVASWLGQHGSPPVATVEKITNAWAKRDPAAAAAWALEQTDPETQWRAVNRATGEWMRQDSMAASEWIADMPDGRAREEAVENLVERIRSEDPAAAFEWIQTMSDPERRMNWAGMTLQTWAAQDPAAVRAAVEASSLPENEKALFLLHFGG